MSFAKYKEEQAKKRKEAQKLHEAYKANKVTVAQNNTPTIPKAVQDEISRGLSTDAAREEKLQQKREETEETRKQYYLNYDTEAAKKELNDLKSEKTPIVSGKWWSNLGKEFSSVANGGTGKEVWDSVDNRISKLQTEIETAERYQEADRTEKYFAAGNALYDGLSDTDKAVIDSYIRTEAAYKNAGEDWGNATGSKLVYFYDENGRKNGEVDYYMSSTLRNANLYPELDGIKQQLRDIGHTDDEIERMFSVRMSDFNEKIRAAETAESQKFADKHPVISSVLSVPESVIGGVGAFGETTRNYFNNTEKEDEFKKPLDLNAPGFSTKSDADTIRETVSSDMGQVGAFLYNTGMSWGDSMLASVIPGGEVFLGAGAASEAIVSAKERGVSDDNALLTGVMAGVFESFFEHFSIGNLKQMQEVPINTFGDLLKNFVKSAGVNASEEVLTEIANISADYFINGGLSEFEANVKAYVASGYTEEEARKKAWSDAAKQVGLAGLAGAIIGGTNTVTVGGTNYAGQKISGAIEKHNNNKIIKYALKHTENSSDTQVQELRAALAEQQKAGKATVEDAFKLIFAESAFSTDGQAAFDIAIKDAVNPETAARQFEINYLRGHEGKEFALDPDSELTFAMQRAAYEYGAEAAKTVANPVKGEYNNTYTEADDGRKVHLRDGGERTDGENTGKQVRVVEESAGRNQSRQTQSQPRDSEATSLTLGKEVSTASFYIPNGSTTDKIYRIAGGETTAMKRAKMLARDRGLEVMFYAGGNMTIDGESVRGYINGKRVFIRADHPQFTADQIMRHEVGHDMIDKGEIDIDNVRDRLQSRYSAEELDEISNAYAEAYDMAGSDLTAEKIFKEVICDSLGDMNVLDDLTLFRGKVDGFLATLKTETEASMRDATNPDAKVEGKKSRNFKDTRGREKEAMENNRFERLRPMRDNLPKQWFSYSYDYFYIYENHSYEDYTVLKKVCITEQNRHAIEKFTEDCENGTYGSAETLDSLFATFWRRKGRNSGYNIDVGDARTGRRNDGMAGQEQKRNNVRYFEEDGGVDRTKVDTWPKVADTFTDVAGKSRIVWEIEKNIYMVKGTRLTKNYRHTSVKAAIEAENENLIRYYANSRQRSVTFVKNLLKSNPNLIKNDKHFVSKLSKGKKSIELGAGSNESAFSMDLDSLDNLHEVNEGLRERVAELEEQLKAKTEQAEQLKGQMKRTTLKSVRAEDVKAAARKIISDYGSEAKVDVVAPVLQKLGDYIVNAEHLDFTDLKDIAIPIAKEIVESSVELTNSEELATFKDIKAYLKGRTIAISEVDSHDIPEFDRFRKRNFGRFTISKTSGEPIDSVYQELNAAFGEYFPEDITHTADQFEHIARVFDDMQPIYENPYSYNMAEAIEYCSNAIIETVLGETVRQNPATFADKAAAKVDAAKAEGRRRLSELRAEKNARIAQLIKEGSERTRVAVKREKKNRDEKIRIIKERYRDSRKKASESRKATELRGKIQRHAKNLSTKLLKPTDKKHIPKDFKDTVVHMLNAINLESNIEVGYAQGADGKFRKNEDGAPPKRTQAFRALKAEYAKILQDGDSCFVPDEDLFSDEKDGFVGLFDQVIAMENIRIADMSFEQLEIVWKTIRSVEKSIDTYNKAFNASRFETISDAAEALYRDNAGKTALAVYGGFIGKGVNAFRNLTTLDMMTPETFLHMLGEAGDSLFRMMRDAQDEHIRIMAEIAEFTHDVFGETDVHKLEKEMHKVTLGDETASLSTAQIMELYVLMRRDEAKEHILIGGILPETQGEKFKTIPKVEAMRGITEEELADAFSILTAEQKQLADKLQTYLSVDMSRRGNEASMEVYGYEKFNKEFYWPIRVNKQEVKSDVQRDTSITTVANRGFTKATKPNAKNSVLIGSIFDTFANHSAEMATYAAWLGTSEDINRIRNFIFKDKSGATVGTVKGIFDRVHGRGGSKYVEKLLSDIAVGIKATYTNPTDILTANTKAAAVAGNIRVIIQQPTAGLRALDMIDTKYFIAGMKPNKGWEKAKKYAPIAQWKDWGYFDIHTGRQMKDVLFDTDSKLDKTKNFFMWGASKADSLTWGMLWNACEVETKANNKALEPDSEEFYTAVAKRFTEVIDHTQVVDGILQRSQIMRQSDALAKMASSFMGEPTKQYNMVMSAAYDARMKKPGAKKKLTRTVVVLTLSEVINAAAQSIIDALRDDDREKEYWEKYLEALIGFTGEEKGFLEHFGSFWQGNVQSAFNPAQYIPYVKDLVSLIQGYDVSRMDMDSVNKFVSAIRTMSKTIAGEGSFTYIGATTNLITEGSRVLGLPFANLKRDITAAISTYTNETDNAFLQYHIDRITYGISLSSNRSRYYDLAFEALSDGDIEAYNIIRADLLKAQSGKDGIDSGDFDSAMRSRYKKASLDSSFSMSRKAMNLIGVSAER